MKHLRAHPALGPIAAIAIPALVTAGAGLLDGRDALTDVVMLYLLGVVVISLYFSFRASVAGAVVSVLAFDFFFIRPYLTLTVADLRHVITFGVMLLVAVVIAGLAQRVRNAEATRLQFETERLRTTLLASISHDLRTPLAVMKGSASTLMDQAELSPDDRRELLSSLLEECERLEQLVTNVLNMTRLQAGTIKLKRELQSVEELLGGALNRLERVLEARRVSVAVPSDLFVLCDAVLIEQVLVNLLDNAAKHTPAGTAIDVSARVVAKELRIVVRDYGEGMSDDELDRAFEKFERGNHRRGPGVGLGLAICRAIAEAHGGRIQASNAAKGGAELCLSLPWEGSLALPPLAEVAEELSA